MTISTVTIVKLALAAALLLVSPVFDRAGTTVSAASGPVVEIRSYNLKPGSRDRFHDLFVREALPMLRRWKVDVVAYGPSQHDRDSYFLMRAFASVEERERSEAAFYESEEWRNGPRAAVLAAIESFTTVVIPADDGALRSLRRIGQPRN